MGKENKKRWAGGNTGKEKVGQGTREMETYKENLNAIGQGNWKKIKNPGRANWIKDGRERKLQKRWGT